MAKYKIVSADDHMDMTTLPPKLFEERLPAAFRDRAPRVVSTPNGNFWQIEGQLGSASGSPKVRIIHSAITRAGIEDNGFRPSTPDLRLKDMDMDGVYAQVIYGPPTGIHIQEPALKAECLKVYNDWSAEFNGNASDRLCVLAYLPMHDPAAAEAELRRAAKQGHKGAVVSFFEAVKPVFEPEWDCVWSAAEELGIPLSFHLGGGFHSIKPQAGSWRIAAFAAVAQIQLDEALAAMIFCGALERRPKMKLVLGESGIGWIPYMIERMDHEFHNHVPSAKDVQIKTLPSQLFARQVYATFEEDHLGVKLLSHIGVDNVMWASDYPHPDSTFPHSQDTIKRLFKGTDAKTVKKLTCDTAAKLYGFKGAMN